MITGFRRDGEDDAKVVQQSDRFRERKEKVHDFTQIFVAYLNNFTAVNKPFENALIEYYTSALGPNLAMFAKRSVRPTLAETYEEAETVEADMESIETYPERSE